VGEDKGVEALVEEEGRGVDIGEERRKDRRILEG
jgi:hypothetical protein